MNPVHPLTVPDNVAVPFHLEQERSTFLGLIAANVNSVDEEHTTLAIEFDFSIDQLWSGNLNGATSGFFCDHVNRFLRECVPEQRTFAPAAAHHRVQRLTPATPILFFLICPFSDQHHERLQFFLRALLIRQRRHLRGIAPAACGFANLPIIVRPLGFVLGLRLGELLVHLRLTRHHTGYFRRVETIDLLALVVHFLSERRPGNDTVEITDRERGPEEVIDFISNRVVEIAHFVRGLDGKRYRHSRYLLFMLVLQPRCSLDLLADLGDPLPINLRSMLQAVQSILQFPNELVCQLRLTGGRTRGLKIRDRSDLVALCFIGHLNEIPPRALLLFGLLLLDWRLLLISKAVRRKFWKRVACDHTYEVE